MEKPCVRVPWMESLLKWNHAVSFSSVIAEPLVPENRRIEAAAFPPDSVVQVPTETPAPC